MGQKELMIIFITKNEDKIIKGNVRKRNNERKCRTIEVNLKYYRIIDAVCIRLKERVQ